MTTQTLQRSARFARHRPGAQRGITILIALIALLVLLFSGMALVRSFDATLESAGGMAFKRDLVNQGERGIAVVWDAMSTGALANAVTRQGPQVGENYSAIMLPSNTQGVPNALLNDDAAFAAVGTKADLTDPQSGVAIRYVVERMCLNPGEENSSHCVQIFAESPDGTDEPGGASPPLLTVYRVTVRVIGPRGTVSYVQSNYLL